MMKRIKLVVIAVVMITIVVGCKAKPGDDAVAVKSNVAQTSGEVIVEMNTSKGKIVLSLDRTHAPITVENFIKYAESGFYNGTIFHRVIRNFMIQGGGFTPDMKQKSTNPPIKNEAGNGLANELGTIAMARTGIVDSATGQFFINTKNNGFLNHRDNSQRGYGYCVFGKVTSGMDVVKTIESVQTGQKGPYGDVPVKTVKILSVKVLKK